MQSQPDSANLNLHETEIHAPFDGSITNKYVEEGSLISSSLSFAIERRLPLSRADSRFIREKVSGVVVIPKDYSRNVLSGKASRAVQSVVGTHNSTTVVNRRMAAGWSSAQAQSALNLSSRMIYNSTGGYIDFFLAALIVHSGQIATVFTMAPSFSLEKKYRRRELEESPFTVLAAKLFVYVIYETAVVAICLAIGVSAFKICHGDFGEIMFLLLTFVAWQPLPQRDCAKPWQSATWTTRL